MMDIKLPFGDTLPCGVCEFSVFSQNLINCRAKARIPENAKSIAVYLFPYYLGEDYYKASNISKYAVPEDYHIIASRYLETAVQELKNTYPRYRFEYFCDNSPIPEVRAAVLAGLGVEGENGLLINEKYGSFCFIGEIVTDMEISPSCVSEKECLKCKKCEKACPGKAIEDGAVSREKCFSDITQRKKALPEELQKFIAESGCIWGCDICQDVCPMNKSISVTPVKEFFLSAKPTYASGDSIENRAYAWRGNDVIERNFKIMCCKE